MFARSSPAKATRVAMSTALLEAVRGLRLAEPDLGVRPLLVKLREQQPDLEAVSKEVREALTALKAESEAAKAAAPAPSVALNLACIGCARLPSDMDDEREKHPVCHKCVKRKLPTTYWCGLDCPANPFAWDLHATFHKEQREHQKACEDGGVTQRNHREAADEHARFAAQTGDKYDAVLAEGLRYTSKEDWRRAARAYREAIALRLDRPEAYYNLGSVLFSAGHTVEAAQQFLEVMERACVRSELWAEATAEAFGLLMQKECEELAKPDWWNDKELKALSARVVSVVPNFAGANQMRAMVLIGEYSAARASPKQARPRSAAELKKAAVYFNLCAALTDAPTMKAALTRNANVARRRSGDRCRAEAMLRYSTVGSCQNKAYSAGICWLVGWI